MSEEKDKNDIWRMLKDPDYIVWIPAHKKIIKDIDEREAEEKKRLTDMMTKLNKTLGKLDE